MNVTCPQNASQNVSGWQIPQACQNGPGGNYLDMYVYIHIWNKNEGNVTCGPDVSAVISTFLLPATKQNTKTDLQKKTFGSIHPAVPPGVENAP